MRRNNRWVLLLLAAALAIPSAARLQAQTPQADQFFSRDRFIQEDIRRQLDANVPADQTTLLTYGGYLIPEYQQSELHRNVVGETTADLRLWSQAVVDDVHRVYVRMRLDYNHFGAGNEPFGWKDDLAGPNLDEGFYELSLSGALRKYFGTRLPADVKMTLGRQFVQFGNGLALSQILDGGVVRVDTGDWRVTGLLGKALEHQTNLDLSPQVADHQDRTFSGFETVYRGLANHAPFFYFFHQNDATTANPPDPFQSFDYNSSYIGVGSNGEVVQNLRYGTELVTETGNSVFQGGSNRDQVRAFAFDQLFEYYFHVKHDPVLSAEYALASGDNDRDSAVSAIGGNRLGTDEQFQGFGYLNTGYAFAPIFTNLQFVRLGGRFKPLPDCETLKKLEIGTDWFLFNREKAGGPVSDPLATNVNESYLGTEVDLYANWRITSDLSVVLRYGRFWTGDAYPTSERRDFVYTGIVFSF